MRIAVKLALMVLLLPGCTKSSAPDAATTASRTDDAERTDSNEPMPAATTDSYASTNPTVAASDGRVELEAITLDAPAAWQSKPPGSSFVLAEFVLPRAEGDDADGRLTISTAGGGVEANIDRWKGQFDPQPQQESQEEVDVAGLKVTVVDFAGDFNDQRGPFAPAVKRPDYRMIAAVIPVEGQLHFVKATGPQKTIAAHADAIHQFIRSVQPTN